MENKPKTGKTAFALSCIVFVFVVILCLLYIKVYTPFFDPDVHKPDITDTLPYDSENEGEATVDTYKNPLPENPIDFSEQMEINDEIYAWIYIPNTNVNYPILQSRQDDLFYMRRGLDKKYLLEGVIFTQSHNSRDFKDPVTLIYGHNMTENGSMFATLHNFENPDFFRDNEDVYIYAPGHILKYKIISAFKYDDRHIMNTYDFDNLEHRREFFDYITSPKMLPQNVREGAYVADDDKIIVLSTCMANNKYRYLVCAVLTEDEITR